MNGYEWNYAIMRKKAIYGRNWIIEILMTYCGIGRDVLPPN